MRVMDRTLTIAQAQALRQNSGLSVVEALERLSALVERHQTMSARPEPDQLKLRLASSELSSSSLSRFGLSLTVEDLRAEGVEDLRRGIYARLRECEDEGIGNQARELVALVKEAA